MKKLFGENISAACKYCAQGSRSTDGTMVLCPKKGMVQPDFQCRKFRYDPLRRQPRRRVRLPEFKPSDFTLE